MTEGQWSPLVLLVVSHTQQDEDSNLLIEMALSPGNLLEPLV